MLDWNGNGRIDPVDIGISIATQNQNDNQEETDTDIEDVHIPTKSSHTDTLWKKFLRSLKRKPSN